MQQDQKLVKWKNLSFEISKNVVFPLLLHQSEDHQVNIEGIQNYEMPEPFSEESFRLVDDDDNDNENDSEGNSIEIDNDKFVLWWRNSISCRVDKIIIW